MTNPWQPPPMNRLPMDWASTAGLPTWFEPWLSANYVTRFEPRTLDDIRGLGGNAPEDDRCFATVSRISDINTGLYTTFARPKTRRLGRPSSSR